VWTKKCRHTIFPGGLPRAKHVLPSFCTILKAFVANGEQRNEFEGGPALPCVETLEKPVCSPWSVCRIVSRRVHIVRWFCWSSTGGKPTFRYHRNLRIPVSILFSVAANRIVQSSTGRVASKGRPCLIMSQLTYQYPPGRYVFL